MALDLFKKSAARSRLILALGKPRRSMSPSESVAKSSSVKILKALDQVDFMGLKVRPCVERRAVGDHLFASFPLVIIGFQRGPNCWVFLHALNLVGNRARDPGAFLHPFDPFGLRLSRCRLRYSQISYRTAWGKSRLVLDVKIFRVEKSILSLCYPKFAIGFDRLKKPF